MNTINMPSRKVLIFLAIIISLILCGLLFFIKNSIVTVEIPKDDSNNIEIINNDAEVVHYSGDIYYFNVCTVDDKLTYRLSKLPIDFDENQSNIKPMLIKDFSTMRDDSKIHVFNGMLYYCYLGNTYQCNIQTNQIKMFCEGEMQYLDEEKYVTLYQGSLYQGIYYPETYVTKSIKQLTVSKFIKLHEDDQIIYYTSPSDNGNTLVMGFKKDNFALVTFDKLDAKTIDVLKISSSENYVFILIETDDSKVIGNRIWEILKIDKETLEKQTISFSKYKDAIFYKEDNVDDKKENDSTKNDIYIYGINEDDAIDTFILKDGKEEVEIYEGELENDLIHNYSVNLRGNEIFLYKNGIELTSVDATIENVSNAKLNYVIPIDDKIYFEVLIDNIPEDKDLIDSSKIKYETILARTPKEGGMSYRINVN